MNDQTKRILHDAARAIAHETRKVMQHMTTLSPDQVAHMHQYFNHRVQDLSHGWRNVIIDDPSLTKIIEEPKNEQEGSEAEPAPAQIRE